MFLILIRNERDMKKKCILVFMYSTRYSCPILMKPDLLDIFFSKNPQISNLMKIRRVGAELFHADGQT